MFQLDADVSKDAGTDTASPYGTRSRNRNGNSRPNYAEDKDIDTDTFDFYHGKKEGDSKKASRQAAAAANGDVPRGGVNSRKAGADDTKIGQSENGSKEQQTGGSTVASVMAQAVTTSQPSRKRKATAQSTAPSTNQAVSTNEPSKKVPIATGPQAGISWPETNMLTFENCGARPVDGQMVADDGTVLEPNGSNFPPKCAANPQTWLSVLTQHCRSCVPGVRAAR